MKSTCQGLALFAAYTALMGCGGTRCADSQILDKPGDLDNVTWASDSSIPGHDQFTRDFAPVAIWRSDLEHAGHLIMAVKLPNGDTHMVLYVSQVYPNISAEANWVIYQVLPNGEERWFGVPATDVVEIREMERGEY